MSEQQVTAVTPSGHPIGKLDDFFVVKISYKQKTKEEQSKIKQDKRQFAMGKKKAALRKYGLGQQRPLYVPHVRRPYWDRVDELNKLYSGGS